VSAAVADPGPPTREEWSLFIARLTEARKVQLSAARATNLPADLHADFAAIWLAYEAVLELLVDQPDLAGDELAAPLIQLGFALADVEGGRAPPLLRPHRRKGTKSTKGGPATGELALMAVAAMALDALIEAGEPRHDAARKVARTIEIARIPLQPRVGASAASTVVGWRDRLREGDGAMPGQALRIWKAYKANPSGYARTARKRAEKFLHELRENPNFRYV